MCEFESLWIIYENNFLNTGEVETFPEEGVNELLQAKINTNELL